MIGVELEVMPRMRIARRSTRRPRSPGLRCWRARATECGIPATVPELLIASVVFSQASNKAMTVTARH